MPGRTSYIKHATQPCRARDRPSLPDRRQHAAPDVPGAGAERDRPLLAQAQPTAAWTLTAATARPVVHPDRPVDERHRRGGHDHRSPARTDDGLPRPLGRRAGVLRALPGAGRSRAASPLAEEHQLAVRTDDRPRCYSPGCPGAGKSTTAYAPRAAPVRGRPRGCGARRTAEHAPGDQARDLGFSAPERSENLRRGRRRGPIT